MPTVGKPAASERGEYYQSYIDRVDHDDLFAALADQDAEIEAAFAEWDESQGDHRYASDKWTVKEVLLHLVDCERIFAFRALSIARGETQDLPGFEENDYAAESRPAARTLASVCEEFRAVRRATRALFEGLDPSTLARVGHANGSPASPRAIGYILVGHARHHFDVLRDRYR